MMNRLAPFLGALFLLSSLTIPAFGADEQPAPTVPMASVLELLRSKQIISDEEAKALTLVGSDSQTARSLVELLKSKGVISPEEAVKVGAAPAPAKETTGLKVLPASLDPKFIAQLRERWVQHKNRGKDFDEWFSGITDPEEIIGRMRVMGAISAAEADQLTAFYRDHYLTGAISAAMQTKEQDYLERVRKGVDWEIDEKIKEKTKGDWSQRIKLSGDFRLRWEQDFFDANNGFLGNPSNGLAANSTLDRQALKLRARLGVDAKLGNDFQVGIGLATDTNRSSGSPVSTNATLGDAFNKKALALDKAYLKWSPDPSFAAWGGRFPSPWYSTDLVWDPDVNFDGAALQYRPQLSNLWGLFLTTGIFPVQEVELSQHDKWLFGSQLGAQYGSNEGVSAKLAVAWYSFMNTVGQFNAQGSTDKDWTAPAFQQKGNTLMNINSDPNQTALKTAYASAFRELNLTGALDLGYWHPVHAVLSADYVNNLGFKLNDVLSRGGFGPDGQLVTKKETEGFQVGLTLGHQNIQEFGDWKGLFFYKYLERDAVMDAFTDSDFHLGGTNAKGWITGIDLGLARDVWFSTRWFSADAISGTQLSIDVLHVNINAKF
jgi:hypothetical protein